MKKTSLIAGAVIVGMYWVSGCSSPASREVEGTAAKSSGQGISLANLDTTVSPCENFFEYANGGWIAANPIPASESRWGSFNELADKNNAIIRQILEESAAASNPQPGSVTQKVGDFYASGMDSLAIEQVGIAPLEAEFNRIAAIQRPQDVLNVVARHKKIGVGSLLRIYVAPDDKNSTQYIFHALQGGLGLPDRDYYLKNDERSREIRQKYQQHLQNMFGLLGDPEARARQNAQTVMNLETRLAKASMERVKMRDPYATYNKFAEAEARKLTPAVRWDAFFSEIGARNVDSLIIAQPDFFKEVNRMISSVPVNEWKTYLRWRLVHDMASALPHAFVNESFDFYGRTLGGTSEMQPRWKRMARATDAALGEAVGQLYVDKTFPPEAKEKALDMVNNLQAAFRQHIAQLDWMTEDTKQKALEKLNSFAVKIGYPDEWKDYSALTVDRGPYVQNYMRANEFEFNRNMSKLGQPVDRNEWFMSPPTVNAYYNPSMNEIVFPAGILQPPFFDPNADDAVNYGGMGAVIGHELTHGFDDQGRQYDAYGNLTDWWTAEDAKKFEQRAQVVQRQFDNYTVLDSIPVNGKLTLGENIADLGGLAIAHTALQKALENNNPGKIDGLTPDQRFFLAWAQIWRTNARDEFLRQQVVVDPHAPAKHRVNGPVKNLPAFREAFGCGVSAPMVRADTAQAQIW